MHPCKPEFFIGEPGRDGGSCAAIHILAIDPLQPWPWASYSQKVPVEGGRSYRIGGWVRTADVTGRGGACMRMEWRDPNNNICSIESMTFLRGTNNWVYYDKKVVAPPDSVAGTIVCSMIDCLGTAWYDDVSFKVE